MVFGPWHLRKTRTAPLVAFCPTQRPKRLCSGGLCKTRRSWPGTISRTTGRRVRQFGRTIGNAFTWYRRGTRRKILVGQQYRRQRRIQIFFALLEARRILCLALGLSGRSSAGRSSSRLDRVYARWPASVRFKFRRSLRFSYRLRKAAARRGNPRRRSPKADEHSPLALVPMRSDLAPPSECRESSDSAWAQVGLVAELFRCRGAETQCLGLSSSIVLLHIKFPADFGFWFSNLRATYKKEI